jgi:predicted RNase H-like HicB family nuclease
MPQSRRLTAIIERKGDGYVALCPELDVASQGDNLEEARTNLIEALTLFFETADASEIEQRFHSDLFVTQVEVPVG